MQTLIAISVWSGCVLLERGLRRDGFRAALQDVLRLHALPTLIFAFVVWVFYVPGLSGSQFVTHQYGIVVQAASLALGGPPTGALAEGLLIAVCVGLPLCAAWLWRDRGREWLFYLLAIFGAPALVLFVSETQSLFVRFFVMSEVFGLLLLAVSLGRLFRTHAAGAAVACAIAAAITYGNAQHIGALLERGRGQYFDALRYMAAEEFGSQMSLGSDHKFGTELMVRFYAPLIDDEEFVYVAAEDPRRAPQWYVRVGHPRPAELIYAKHLYERDRLFETSAFGFSWQLYRRVPMVDALRRRGVEAP